MAPDSLSDLIVPVTPSDVSSSYAALAERARDAVFGFEDEVAIVDIETTGFDPIKDRIIEVAASIMRGPEVIARFDSLADPGCLIPPEITTLTGIDDAEVAGAPSVEVAVARLAEFVGNRDLVAHNAEFDRAFLTQVRGADMPGAWVDTLALSRVALPRLKSHRLRDLAQAFGVPVAPRHRAADDVEALGHVWRFVRCGLEELPPALLTRLAALAPDADWSLRALLSHHARARSGTGFDLRDSRRARAVAGRGEAMSDAEEVACSCPPADVVVAEFSAQGVAGRMYEGFEQREEQTRMAEAVLGAFGTRTHLAVEAGTGVGKSVAYLVPIALFAQENRVTVGVATKTNALMDQLVYHELPRLADALPSELRYVTLKGYDHYLCLRKLERYAADLDESADEERINAVAMLLAWVVQSAWGDVDQVNTHWRQELRSAVTASRADCTRKRCRYYPNLCYLHGVRRHASSAHVVVTNHALLFRDMVSDNALLPPIRHWVVDEAHAAEAEARAQLTLEASHSEISVSLGALRGRGQGSLLHALRRELADTDDAAAALSVIARMDSETERAANLADSLFDYVKDLLPLASESSYDACELRLSATVRESSPWETVRSVGSSLCKRLDRIVDDGRHLVALAEAAGVDAGDARADFAGVLTRLAAQAASVAVALEGEDDSLVYWARLDRRRDVHRERLVAAHIDIGEVLARDFYPRSHSVIFTSGTIATGSSFDYFERAVGLDRLEPERWRALRLPSSYDLERQMAVFVASDMPDPRAAEYTDSLEQLLLDVHRAMAGSVLTLFTNRRDLEEMYRRLEPTLRGEGLSLIRQHRGTSAKRLRDEFIAEERLSLMALKSFWEGFDAKGDTLRCVIVPKLPFGRPTDPLSQEREEREGRSAWSRYVLPEAVIELKQAAGRLVRSKTDAGCLVIADSRTVGKAYGASFLKALPVADVERLSAVELVEQVRERFGRIEVG